MNRTNQTKDGRLAAADAAAGGSLVDMMTCGIEGLAEMILPPQKDCAVATLASSYRLPKNSGHGIETPGSPGVSAVPCLREAASPTSVSGLPREMLTSSKKSQLSLPPSPPPSPPPTAAMAALKKGPPSPAVGAFPVIGPPPGHWNDEGMGAKNEGMSCPPPPIGEVETVTKKDSSAVSLGLELEGAEEETDAKLDQEQFEKAFYDFLVNNPSKVPQGTFADTSAMLQQKLIKMNQDKARVENELKSQLDTLIKSKRAMEEELEGQLKKLIEAKSAKRRELHQQVIAAHQAQREMEESMQWDLFVRNVDMASNHASLTHGHGFVPPKRHHHMPTVTRSDGINSMDGSVGSGFHLHGSGSHLDSVDEEEEYNRSDSSNDGEDKCNQETRQEKEDVDVTDARPSESASTLSGTSRREGNSGCDKIGEEIEEETPSEAVGEDGAISWLEKDLQQFRIDNALLTSEISVLKKKLEAQGTKKATLARVEDLFGQLDGDLGEVLSSKLQAGNNSDVDRIDQLRGAFDVVEKSTPSQNEGAVGQANQDNDLPTEEVTILNQATQEPQDVIPSNNMGNFKVIPTPSTEESGKQFCANVADSFQNDEGFGGAPHRPVPLFPGQENQGVAAEERKKPFSFHDPTIAPDNEDETLDVAKEMMPKGKVGAIRKRSRSRPVPEL